MTIFKRIPKGQVMKQVAEIMGRRTKQTEKIVVEEADKVADQTIKSMQKYPAKRSGQKYVRTNTLKRSWKKIRTSTSVSIKNDAKQRGRRYPKFVVGDEKGNWQNSKYHAGRWPLFIRRLEYFMKRLKRNVLKRMKAIQGKKK